MTLRRMASSLAVLSLLAVLGLLHDGVLLTSGSARAAPSRGSALAALTVIPQQPESAAEPSMDAPAASPAASAALARPSRVPQPPLANLNAAATTAAELAPGGDARTSPFPVVLLAHARPERLNLTLASLVRVRHLDRRLVFVLQDGADPRVEAVVRSYAGLNLARIRGGSDRRASSPTEERTGGPIARAYKAALSHAFDALTTDDALIVVEDDLLFSPDLMDFFLAGYHVQRADPSLWCVAAWNDNGCGGLVRQPHKLLRTGYFPGLGWLLTRSLYKTELEPRWPTEHWDHWMRSETVHRTSRGRECLYPQVRA